MSSRRLKIIVPYTILRFVSITNIFGNISIDSASVGLLRAEVCNELLKEGIYYHKINARRSGGIAARLSLASVSLFLLTVAVVYFGCVMSIFSDVPPRISTLLSMLASVLPICSAAIVAFRQSSEFELLEAKSNQMHAALVDAYDRLNKLDCTQPWAAELLGDELVRIADLMTADVADWSLVFKVKAVETA